MDPKSQKNSGIREFGVFCPIRFNSIQKIQQLLSRPAQLDLISQKEDNYIMEN